MIRLLYDPFGGVGLDGYVVDEPKFLRLEFRAAAAQQILSSALNSGPELHPVITPRLAHNLPAPAWRGMDAAFSSPEQN
ncbi:1561_t:CDS:2, partial [Acaulospora colombiana]